MFSGEKLLEDLRSDNSLMKTMVDRFGEDVTDQYQTGTKCIFATGTIIYEIICWIAIRI